MSAHLANTASAVLALPPIEQVGKLAAVAADIAATLDNGAAAPDATVRAVRDALVSLVQGSLGSPRERLALGEALGRLGDPRLLVPDSEDYWTRVRTDEHEVMVGRYPVTTAEFQSWVASGGYDQDAHWSAEGLAWRNSGDHTWVKLAADPEVAHLVIPNQPAVGLNWFEAEAYARAHGARLLTLAERRWVVRGLHKRPYPWGQPFGEGNANTREEALGKPCAVGLFVRDRTPEGVADLAGNVAEWTADGNGTKVIHPGSWVRPSMASWAKALDMVEPTTRSADLGCRLARDA